MAPSSSTPSKNRIEKDSLGELEVPIDALYGAHTERAVQNFKFSGITFPREFIRAIGLIKFAAAEVNQDLGLIENEKAKAIMKASEEVAQGQHDKDFPIDIFQTGSGTSTNMNTNEVIARLAHLQSNLNIHPNDDVNMCQSSNDVIPTAIHLSASLAVKEKLMPAVLKLKKTLEERQHELEKIVKTGRTHLMDAVPVTFAQQISGYVSQVDLAIKRIEAVYPRLHALAIGGTAVGTGLNAPKDFGQRVAKVLSKKTEISLECAANFFEAISCQDTIVELSGQLRVLAVSVIKIANDLRWMNSGPLAGIGEIALPTIQPGSSIMPGKVNPVIAEATLMVCAQIIGNDTTIMLAGQSGNFQLNTMLPVIGYNILQSIEIFANTLNILADKAIKGFKVNEERIKEKLMQNPILITALNPVIGYEKGAAIVRKAYGENKSILEVALEMTTLGREELEKLLNPLELTQGGIKKSKPEKNKE